MPVTVPTYGKTRELPSASNQLPSVRQTAAPSADQLGGNARVPTDYVGKGMQFAGRDLEHVGLQMQQREDADMVFRAETVLKDKLRQQSEQWLQRRGVNAWNVTKDADAWWQTEATKAAEGLNERQRLAFDQTAARLRSSSLDSLSRYEAEQRRASLDESAQANVVGSINHAVANVGDEAALTGAREDIERAIAVRAGINGWVPARAAVERLDKLGTLHDQMISELMRSDPKAAEEYLTKYRDEIPAAKLAGIKTRVETGVRLAKVQGFADEFDPRKGATLQDALDEARKRFEGEDEKLAIAEVKTRFAEHKQIVKEADDAIEQDVYRQLNERGSLSRVDPELLSRMSPKARANLVNVLESRASASESRAAARESREWTRQQRAITVTEAEGYATYAVLSDTLGQMRLSPEEKVRIVREEAIQHRISPAQAERLVLQVTNNAVRADAVHIPTLKSVMDPLVKEAKWKGDKGRAMSGLLQQTAEDRILAAQQAKGRPLTQDEMRTIVKDLMVQGEIPGRFFDTDARRFEVLGTDDEAKWRTKSKGTSAPVSGPVKPAAANPPAGGGAPRVRIRDAADYARLAPGTKYIDPQGNPRTKP